MGRVGSSPPHPFKVFAPWLVVRCVRLKQDWHRQMGAGFCPGGWRDSQADPQLGRPLTMLHTLCSTDFNICHVHAVENVDSGPSCQAPTSSLLRHEAS